MALALVVGLLSAIPTSPAAAQEQPPQPTCEDFLIGDVGNQEVVGEVCAVDEDGVLSVTLSTFDGWVMSESSLAVSADEPGARSEWRNEGWQNPAGNVSPGQWPHKAVHDPVTDSHTYEIPLSEISGGVRGGDEIKIAAQAKGQRTNITTFIETAFLSIGEEEFELPSCPDGIAPDEDTTCLFLHGYELNGSYVVPPENVSIPPLEDEVSLPIVGTQILTVTLATPEGISGILDRDTGEITVDMPMDVRISIGTLTQPNCRLPGVAVNATTGESGDLTGSPLVDDRATVVDGLFAVPGAVDCGTIFFFVNLNTAINNELNLPQPSGNNALEFGLLFAEGWVLPTTHEVVAPGFESGDLWSGGERFRNNHPAAFFRHTVVSDPLEPGSISGTVTDASTEAPIEGATVTADGHEATTDENGEYTLADLQPDTYEVTASAEGYETSDPQTVEVGEGEEVTGVDFALTPVAAPQPGSISGTVTDASTEAPIEGALVETDAGDSATTGPDGTYTIPDVDPGTYEVTASAEGYHSDSQTVEVGDGEDVTDVDFALEPVVVEPQPGSISGTVTDASTEAPIEGATVEANGHSATTGPDGSYTIADLEPGTYEVTASAEGYHSDSQTVEVGEGEEVTGVDFALEPVVVEPDPGSISGTVTDASTEAPIEGATVEANGHSATTGPDGSYTIADLEPGTYEVTASAEGYFPSDPVTVEVGDGEDVVGVDFALVPIPADPGSISGTVTDASTEAPIEGATVTADGHEATTDENGEYTIADLEPGTYEVTASAEGYFPSDPVTVEVGEGEDVTGVDFALTPQNGSISGTVTDASTTDPIEGATVETDAGHSATTGPDGSYTIADLEPGTYEVTASAEGYFPSDPVTVEVGEGEDVTGVDFALTPQNGSISGTVTDASTTDPIEGATVETDAGHSATTDENGNYTIEDVEPGTYEVTASAEGYHSDSQEVTVGPGQDVTGVDFALTPQNGSISGTVTDASTTDPIEGATVETDAGHSATTGPDGSYTIEDVEPGTYEVTASADGYFADSQTVEVGPGQDVTGVDFALVPIPADPGSISGTVTDASTEAPIEGATVTADGHEATTDENGEYTIADLEPGTYEVTASAEGYFPSDPVTVEVGEGEDVTGVDFALTPQNGSISGTVTDASTTDPIEGATVETDAGHSATTGPDGSYTIEDVEPGTYEVTASAEGYHSDSQEVTVGPGQDVTGVDFALTPQNGSISGTVTDASTTDPIEGATVETDAGHSATTGPDGSYTIADLEPGTYEVTASAEGYESDSQEVTVGPGEDVTDVDFALEAVAPPALIAPGPFTAVVEGGLLNAAGNEFPFTECPDGVPADPEAECISFSGEVLDEDGNFVVPAGNVSFPAIEIRDDPDIIVDLDVLITAAEDITGTIDPVTGDGDFAINLSVDVDLGPTGEGDCRMSVVLDTTTGTSGDLTGDPLGTDGRITVVDGLFAIPNTTPIGPSGFLCPLVDDGLGLPSPSGENSVEFNLLITQP